MMLVPVSRIVELVALATPMPALPPDIELRTPKADEVGHQVTRQATSQLLEVRKDRTTVPA
jgi:hypothetical protein